MSKVVVLMSGGLDSTVLAAALVKGGYEVIGLGVNYGQRHECELRSAKAVAERLGVPHTVVDISPELFEGAPCSQTKGAEVPEGHYAEPSMRTTVVPNRNMVLLALATAHAISVGAEAVAYAAHAGDHAVYPDCRPEFVGALAQAIDLCDYEPPHLWAPFVEQGKTKADIAKLGFEIEAPLGLTWSCYRGGDSEVAVHCGRCSTCVERAEAFSDAGVPDPTIYDDPDFWRKAVAAFKAEEELGQGWAAADS